MKKENIIGGIFGKKGSGKSDLAKKIRLKFPRTLTIDPLWEYSPGLITYDYAEAIEALYQAEAGNFQVVYRPPRNREAEDLDRFFPTINLINDYMLFLEEVDFHCNPHYLHPEIDRLTRYGRHDCRSLLYISRSPAEISRFLTRQSDVLISFKQTEPIDLKWLNNFTWSKDISTLGKYEYAFSGSEEVFSKLSV